MREHHGSAVDAALLLHERLEQLASQLSELESLRARVFEAERSARSPSKPLRAVRERRLVMRLFQFLLLFEIVARDFEPSLDLIEASHLAKRLRDGGRLASFNTHDGTFS